MGSKRQLSNYEIKTNMHKWHNSKPEPKPISYLQKVRNQNQNQNAKSCLVQNQNRNQYKVLFSNYDVIIAIIFHSQCPMMVKGSQKNQKNKQFCFEIETKSFEIVDSYSKSKSKVLN